MKKTFTIKLDEVECRTAEELTGAPIHGERDAVLGRTRNGSWPTMHDLFHSEALHALLAFKRQRGYVPRLPRFEVMVGENGLPQDPRRWEMYEEMRGEQAQVEEVLARYGA